MREKRFEDYRKRNRLLKVLGFNSYQDYLNSDLWKKIRAAKLKQEWLCYSCFARANQVHHKRYTFANLKGLTLANLMSVCGRCHLEAEFHENGGKMSVKAASNKLRRMRKANRIKAGKAQTGG